MTSAIQKFVKILILILCGLGAILVLKTKFETSKTDEQTVSSKALTLKKYFLAYDKPARIEIIGLSNRFAEEIKQIKSLKVPQDPKSDFYITVQLFSDENDTRAPLIAQIRFIDLKSGNLKKEESINLE